MTRVTSTHNEQIALCTIHQEGINMQISQEEHYYGKYYTPP